MHLKFVVTSFKQHLSVSEPVFYGDLVYKIYRGSYVSAHVLLNLLNELGKRDKMRGLPSI